MNHKPLIGVDDVGTTAVAGPLTACACYVPPERWDELRSWGFTDSKNLEAEQRQELVERLEANNQGVTWSIVQVDPVHIDILTPQDAWFKAARTAAILTAHRMDRFLADCSLLVDGRLHLPNLPDMVHQAAVPGADELYLPVSVASVLARVHRDKRMAELDRAWPLYNLAVNGGHPTLEHLTVILRVGPVYGVHRKHFLKKALRVHYDKYLKHAMREPDWLKDDRWLRNVEDDGVVIETTWPVINPDHPVYRQKD